MLIFTKTSRLLPLPSRPASVTVFLTTVHRLSTNRPPNVHPTVTVPSFTVPVASSIVIVPTFVTGDIGTVTVDEVTVTIG